MSEYSIPQCHIPPDLTSQQQCDFVRKKCSSPEDAPGLIHYLDFYYCTMGTRDLKPLASIVLLVHLIFLFVFLGTAASDYFCPNLSTLSNALRLPPDVAGATFLALGNSAPDLFSSLAAIHSADSIGMALGELIGAGLFVGCFVVGAVALFGKEKPGDEYPAVWITLHKRIFLRDIGFLLVSILILGLILIDGKLHWWEGLIMLLLYAFYVLLVIAMGYPYNRKGRSSSSLDRPPSPTASVHSDSALFSPRTEEYRTPGDEYPTRSSSCSFDDAFQPADRVIRHRISTAEMYRQRCSSMNAAVQLWDAWRDAQSRPASRSLLRHHQNRLACPTCKRAAMTTTQAKEKLLASYGGRTFTARSYSFFLTVIHHLFPIFSTWHMQGFMGRIVGILNIPAVVCLGLTVPVVAPTEEDDEVGEMLIRRSNELPHPPDSNRTPGNCKCGQDHGEENAHVGWDQDIDEKTPLMSGDPNRYLHAADFCSTIEWHHRWIIIMQSLLAPSFILFALGYHDVSLSDDIWFPGYILGVILGVVLASLVALFMRPDRHLHRVACFVDDHRDHRTITVPWRSPLLSFIGFLIGVLWIFFIANEVVGLLKAAGKILKIGDPILGVTILAFGNSIGDLVSNVTIARMGFPTMSISASFAGPLINLLLTLGVSGMIGIGKPPAIIKRSLNVDFTYAGLLVLMLVCYVGISAQKFRIHRYFGATLVAMYVLVIGVTITLDLAVPDLKP